jgi:hypothetical protein
VRRVIGARTDREVSTGVIYATLDRLEAKRYVKSRLGDGGSPGALTAIWTFHRHASLLRDQDGAPFGGQLGASTPNCLAYEADAEALPLWEKIWPGPAMKLVSCPT